MTTHELKAKVDATGSHFFDRETLKFFGDTMRNFACGRNPIEITDKMGELRQVYALWRIKTNAKLGKYGNEPYYFDAVTFAQVRIKKD